jgi:hypothetical protein
VVVKAVWVALLAGGIAAGCSAAAPDPVPLPTATPAIGEVSVSVAETPVTSSDRAAQVDDAPSGPSTPPAELHEGLRSPTVPSTPSATPSATPVPAASLDAVVAELRALTPDPAPEHTTNDVHYLISNERRHDLFRPDLDDLGGVMLGVGSDQSYVMAAWSHTELLVIVDFDQKVVDLHAIHGALMGAAPTVEELRRLWSDEGADDARAVLERAFDEPARRQLLLDLYDEAREAVDGRLRRLARRYEELGVHSYLDTPEQYRFIADLHAHGRVVALRGDFIVDGLLREIARVLTEHQQRVKVLYLSNIEQYFTYRRPFRDNMLALPFDDDTLVLRTLPARPAGFQYILQSGDDFRTWIRKRKVWSVYGIRGFTKGEPLEANKRVVVGPPPVAK